MDDWGWQQWYTVLMYFVMLAGYGFFHGKPTGASYNFPGALVLSIWGIFVLGSAGFFA